MNLPQRNDRPPQKNSCRSSTVEFHFLQPLALTPHEDIDFANFLRQQLQNLRLNQSKEGQACPPTVQVRNLTCLRPQYPGEQFDVSASSLGAHPPSNSGWVWGRRSALHLDSTQRHLSGAYSIFQSLQCPHYCPSKIRTPVPPK